MVADGEWLPSGFPVPTHAARYRRFLRFRDGIGTQTPFDTGSAERRRGGKGEGERQVEARPGRRTTAMRCDDEWRRRTVSGRGESGEKGISPKPHSIEHILI